MKNNIFEDNCIICCSNCHFENASLSILGYKICGDCEKKIVTSKVNDPFYECAKEKIKKLRLAIG